MRIAYSALAVFSFNTSQAALKKELALVHELSQENGSGGAQLAMEGKSSDL